MRLGELAARLDAGLKGDSGIEITGVASLATARSGDLSFITDGRYKDSLETTRASAVIVPAESAPLSPVPVLIASNPHLAFARAAALLMPSFPPAPGVHPSAVVDPGASAAPDAVIGPNAVVGPGAVIAAGVVIGAGAVIGEGCSIGADSVIGPRVTIIAATVGARAIIHPGAVVGADGFGFADDDGRWVKVPQLGRVLIGDDVEIGANTTIDRGALDDTVIGDGVKIDNLVQIAHNVTIGADTAIAGCAGMAGSARIGRRCRIGGGAGILGHLEIADEVTIGAMSLVTRSISEAGVYASGTPLQPLPLWRRNRARMGRLDEMARRLERLERTVHKGDGR